MIMASRNPRQGSALVEFSLLGIPAIFVFLSVAMSAIDMWQFYTLAYAVDMTSRYVGMHGATCSQNSNTCTITVANIVAAFETYSPALSTSGVNLTLTDGSGATSCNPITTCASTSTQFPSASYNSVGSNITVKATFKVKNPIAMLWPGAGFDPPAEWVLGATSTQRIVF